MKVVIISWTLLALTFIAFLMSGCALMQPANQQSEKTVSIHNASDLFITDMFTDNHNTVELRGTEADGSATIPISGIPTPFDAQINMGGVLRANRIDIVMATGGTVVIERLYSGNVDVPAKDILPNIIKPSAHPFGNVTGEGVLREHVINEPE